MSKQFMEARDSDVKFRTFGGFSTDVDGIEVVAIDDVSKYKKDRRMCRKGVEIYEVPDFNYIMEIPIGEEWQFERIIATTPFRIMCGVFKNRNYSFFSQPKKNFVYFGFVVVYNFRPIRYEFLEATDENMAEIKIIANAKKKRR